MAFANGTIATKARLVCRTVDALEGVADFVADTTDFDTVYLEKDRALVIFKISTRKLAELAELHDAIAQIWQPCNGGWTTVQVGATAMAA